MFQLFFLKSLVAVVANPLFVTRKICFAAYRTSQFLAHPACSEARSTRRFVAEGALSLSLKLQHTNSLGNLGRLYLLLIDLT